MKNNVTLFPSYKIGLKPGDEVAVVARVKNRLAKTVKKEPNSSEELGIFAHNDMIVSLKVGDWVRVAYTPYGPIIIERLAQPGERPLPRTEYLNGRAYVKKEDPAWRLYND